MTKIPDTLKYLIKVNIPVFLLSIIIPFILNFELLTYVFFIVCYILIYLISGNMYHRYWSHKQFSANSIFLKITSILGLFIMVGDPISYAKSHRYHHAHSDTDKDLHSPVHGIFHALIGWMFVERKLPLFLVRDLITEPHHNFLIMLANYQIKIIWIGMLICYIIDVQLFAGLIYAMLLGFTMEMLTNAFGHDAKKRVAVNNYPIALISMTQLHHEHHCNPLSTKKDMGSYLLLVLEKFKFISR